MRRAINIEWDYDEGDGTAQFLGLPDHVDIPNNINENEIADYLSDTYNFCVYGFSVITV